MRNPDSPDEPVDSERPRLAVLVANGVTGDSRVQKVALAAARDGWDVTLVGITQRNRTQHSRLDTVPIVRLALPRHARRAAETRKQRKEQRLRRVPFGKTFLARSRTSGRSGVLPWRLSDKEAVRTSHARFQLWERQVTARLGMLLPQDEPEGRERFTQLSKRARLKALLKVRRGLHSHRLASYQRAEYQDARKEGEWQRALPVLRDYDLAFGQFLEKLRPDVIHANDVVTVGPAARTVARLRARGLSCSWLYDAHEYVAGVEWQGPTRHYIGYEQEFVKHANAVATVSEGIATLLQRDHGLRQRPTVAQNAPVRDAVDLTDERFSVRRECGLAERVPLLVYAGWLAENRGLDTVVEALTDLPDTHLALVCNGRPPALWALLKRADALGVAHRVHTVGYVHQHAVSAYLSSADLGVIPLRHAPNHEESLPTKYAEYLHAGLPVVVSDVRFLAEHVRQHGVGVVHSAGDAHGCAAAVRTALADTEQLSAQISEQLLTELSWEHQATGLLRLYRECSGRQPHPPEQLVPWTAQEPGLRVFTPDGEPAADTDAADEALGHAGTARSGVHHPEADRLVSASASTAREAGTHAQQSRTRGPCAAAWRSVSPTGGLRDTTVRLGVGPANYAGQAAAFAQAVCQDRADTSAEVFMVRPNSPLEYPADRRYSAAETTRPEFQSERVRHILTQYTHLLVDAFKPVFGQLNGEHVDGDLPALHRAGVRVALLAHGSEVRDPHAHLERLPDSMFRDAPPEVFQQLVHISAHNRRIAADFPGPVLVTTPDLLHDLPEATWSPLVVDVAYWACVDPAMRRERPVVLHAPSRRWTKNTDRILPPVRRLHDQGAIELRLVEGLTPGQMREQVHQADIVLDQFGTGSYGLAACEAMAAGRIVLASLDEEAQRAVGVQPPIVHATADTIDQALRSLLDDRDEAARLARSGVDYTSTVHDGTRTVEALKLFLG